jgi:hypothetical protein
MLAHLIHGVLHGWAVFRSEQLHGDIPGILPGLIELCRSLDNRIQSRV